MTEQTVKIIIEGIGYFGSLMIIVAMLMTSVVKLRVINSIGCAIFAAYALIIHSYPTAIMQLSLIVINAVGLYKLLRMKKNYSVVYLSAADSYLKHFLHSHAADITKYFPSAEVDAQCNAAYLVCSGETPVGIILGTFSDYTFSVQIDYTVPAYRDCSVGKYLYAYLSREGIRTLSTKSTCPVHESYLQKMGFALADGVYTKTL